MRPAAAQKLTARTVRLVALPAEHGGWGFLIEPVLLGLLVAPSVAGLWLSLAALAAFLVRQPLKLALADRLAGKRYPRSVLAERVALLYGSLALLALLAAVLTSQSPFWVPIALAAPAALLQAYYDNRRQSRQLAAELAGALALGASVSAIALAGGLPLAEALALLAVLGARSVPSILYVRARLRQERGEPFSAGPSLASHLVGLALVTLLWHARLLPWAALLAMGVLAARASWGLSSWHRPARAQVIGVQEVAFGLLTVLLVAAGYYLR